MQILIIDNYDSFTYNLVQYMGELGAELDVRRNDAASVEALLESAPRGLVISPGPGVPQDAGVSIEAVKRFGEAGVPVFGVCLGHQSIGEAYGGRTVRAKSIMHGKTSLIEHDGKGVFAGLPQPFEATRYHSLVVEEASLPEVLEISARTADGEIMGLRHRELAVEGVQFHPESILTGVGKALLDNFLSRCREGAGA
ncbi:MAG: aminodeoxychorismate/anthranilate synthase component II [bacterium]|nr:aminodeoxychorismate/anthranilate synthase component II [bacterium]